MAVTITLDPATGLAVTVPSDLQAYICTASSVLAVPFVQATLGLSATQAAKVIADVKAQCGAPKTPPGPLATEGPLGISWLIWGLGAGGLVLWLAFRDR